VFVQWVGRQLKKGKKKSKDAALEEVEKEWVEFKEIKVQEIEQLKEFTLVEQEKNIEENETVCKVKFRRASR
jgi:long-subunit acyl-CoA synthetase (AMP-forming)